MTVFFLTALFHHNLTALFHHKLTDEREAIVKTACIFLFQRGRISHQKICYNKQEKFIIAQKKTP